MNGHGPRRPDSLYGKSRQSKSRRSRKRVLRNELLEPRHLLSGSGLPLFAVPLHATVPAVTVGSPKLFNSAPTIAQPISVYGNGTVTGRAASLSVMGSDDGGEAKLVYQWSVTAAPLGGTATFSSNGTNSAKYSTITFTKAGSYNLTVKIVDGSGLSVSATKTVVVAPTLTRLVLTNSSGQMLGGTAILVVSGVSQTLVAQGVDQFGYVMAGSPALVWSASTLPLNANQPSFATDGKGLTTVTFAMAGGYVIGAYAANARTISCATTVSVSQTLTSIAVSPNTPSVLQGTRQQFVAQALDQFQKPMTNQQAISWSASAGTISTAGLYTAPTNVTRATVYATSGKVTGAATVTITANSGKLQNAALAKLVQSLDADGSLNRQDMIQILRSVGTDGAVDATELSDLKTVLNQAATLKIPDYVQVLAGDVVNGNAANAAYQGKPLGNLTAGSLAAQLNKLVDKWFLGADHPTLCNTSLVYRSTAGSLFPHTPSHLDEYQGQLGDCYFISALGTLADSNPAAVQNMFLDNGDGTWTVRFYTGNYGTIYNYSDGSIGAGFKDNLITVDYVTVDRMLPTSASGMLVYANYGANYVNTANSLWIPLAEKAYAQWNETGKEGRDGLNAYASIQGGWMATVDAQVLGHNATDYIMTNTKEQVAVNALTAKKAVTIGTLSWSGTKYGLYATHAYAIVGYSAATDTFTLYNPWGSSQPGQLTWKQLQETCSQLAVADTAGSIAISGVALQAAAVKCAFSDQASHLPMSLFGGKSTTEVLSGASPGRAAPDGPPSAAVDASLALLDASSSRATRSHAVAHGGQGQTVLTARLVDATLADGGLLAPWAE